MDIRGKLKQVGEIIQAFTNTVPVDKEWFQHRISVCDPCEYNSKNKTEEELSFSDKLKIKGPFQGDPMCTACGCCVPRKAGLEKSVCGLTNVGKTPKWTALKTFGLFRKSLSLENIETPEGCVFPTVEGFVYNTEKVTEGVKVIRLKFKLGDSKGLKLKSILTDATCLAVKQERVDGATIEISVDVSTVDFKVGIEITNSITVQYYQAHSDSKEYITQIDIKTTKTEE